MAKPEHKLRARLRARAPRLGDERGLTLVEMLVAVLILASGALAVLQTFDASIRNTYRAEQTQVAVNRAQRELEAIQALEYRQIALTSMPVASAADGDPRSRVSGSTFALGSDGSNPAEMAVNGYNGVSGGTISPGPTPFTSGDISGNVNRFVVWQNDPECSELAIAGVGGCPGTRDFKRVVVVVSLDESAITYERAYHEIQSDFTDPDATVLDTGEPPAPGDIVTAQQLFLSDTPCGQSSRQPIAGDHATHDTLGKCSGSSPPDGLYTDAPPDPAPEDAANPPLYDYASDPAVEPQPTNLDKGLQMLRQDANGCDFAGGASNQRYKVHRWLTQPMPLAFVLTGQATLEFYTRTIDDVNVPGEICVWLFHRDPEVPLLPATDHLLIDLTSPPNPYFHYSEQPWPRYQWTRRRLVMSFAPTTLVAGQRLGLALAVRRDGTPQDALEFIYDHPDYASRLEVKTTTPLD